MKVLPVIAVALMACADLTDAWAVNAYKATNLKGTKATLSGKSRSGSKCYKINNMKGPNLGGKVGSLKIKTYDTKAKSLCKFAFYSSSNCKKGRGDACDGYGTFTFSGSAKMKYYSMKVSCGKLNYKRSEIDGDGEWNATASALDDIDMADLEEGEEYFDPEEWDEADLGEWFVEE